MGWLYEPETSREVTCTKCAWMGFGHEVLHIFISLNPRDPRAGTCPGCGNMCVWMNIPKPIEPVVQQPKP